MRKVVLFAFNGELTCFVHVLLNGLDMKERDYDVKIVIEGPATKLVPEISQDGAMFHDLYAKAKGLDIIAGACKACSAKMGALEGIRSEGITLLDDISGHPSMARYQLEGYEVITF
ncbi:MAG TPA: cytoplasmic protein [Deltaproteobacteria bacterium]|nr:cytoplasmic protein [Deltaproteobacteria bacterium]